MNPVAKDKNSCFEVTLCGGVLGGALGALGGVLAKKDNWIWSFLLGLLIAL